jgi:hypothetical protein
MTRIVGVALALGIVGLVNGIMAAKEKPLVNSLGMKFVPVPGPEVLFSIWVAPVRGYEVFVNAAKKPIGQGC